MKDAIVLDVLRQNCRWRIWHWRPGRLLFRERFLDSLRLAAAGTFCSRAGGMCIFAGSE